MNCKKCGIQINEINKIFSEKFYGGLCSACAAEKIFDTGDVYNKFLEGTLPEPEFPPFEDVLRDMTCKHINQREDWYGDRWYSNGDVSDTYYSVLRCADCGLILSGKEEDYGEDL